MEIQNIAQLKREFGELFQITVAPSEEGQDALVFVFRKPDRKVLAASAKIGQSDPIKGAEVMLNSCLVHGDSKLLDDIAVFQAVSGQFGEMNKAREATLKKL